MTISKIKKVCFVGAGTMGCWNALLTVIAGYDAVVYDVSEKMLETAPKRQKRQIKIAAGMGLMDADIAQKSLSRVSFTNDANEAVNNADLLSESIPENLELKRRIHTKFDLLCPEKTIFTTNTSSLLVSEIEDAVTRRHLFAALHFHLFGSLIDIVAGPKTHPDVIKILEHFSRQLNQTPVVHTREKDGYLWNSLLIMNHKTAVMLAADGYGTPENIDRSVMAAGYNKTGPFAQLDMVGLDLARTVFLAKFERDNDIEFKKAADFLDTYVQNGHLGVKTGKGFYTYPKPAWSGPDFLK